MSSKTPTFTFGNSNTNRVYSVVDANGTGVVVRRDNESGSVKYWQSSIDTGTVGSWAQIDFTFPDGVTTETLEKDQPFYLGYNDDSSNPIIYVYETDDEDDFYSIQYSNFYDYQLTKFENDSDYEACTMFFAKDNLVALCDTDYNYYLGDPQEDLFQYTNPDEKMDRIVQDLSITGGKHAVPAVLLYPLPDQTDPVRIRWWQNGDETYFEDSSTRPEAIVCFDDYIVWHSNGSGSSPTIGWIEISKTGTPVTTFDSFVAKSKTVAITKSGSLFQSGDIWYGTSDGMVYYVDKKDSHKVLDAKNDISGASSTISQLWADNYFLYVLTDNGLGGAWKIADVK